MGTVAAPRVLVLGGGTGGLVAAKTVARLLAEAGGEAEVTLITDSPWHEFKPLFADVAFGTARPEETRAPIKSLERLGVRVLLERVERIDLANRAVITSKGSHGYDYLVVSLGVRYGWEAYPGLAEAGYHNYTLDAARELGRALAGFRGGRIVVLVPELPHRCGMYPHEAATIIAEAMRKRGVRAEVAVVAPGRAPMARLSEEYAKVWLAKYEELGIEYVRHKGLQEVDPEKRVIRAGNVEERYDLLVKVPPSRLPEPLERSEGFKCSQDGRWACVEARRFRHPRYEEVFMVGEHSMPPAGLPTAGIPIHFAADYAAQQIVSEITGAQVVSGLPSTLTCVGYYGVSSGFAGTCEVGFDEKEGRWRLGCYVSAVNPMVKLMKEAFYKSWIASLK